MKTSSFIKMMIAVLVAFASTACSDLEKYPGYQTVEYTMELVNASSHTIYAVVAIAGKTYTLQDWGEQRVEGGKVVLPPLGRSLVVLQSSGMWDEKGYPSFGEVLCEAPIVYIDGSVKMKFTAAIDSPYNIGNAENFAQVTEDSHTFYRYTFTDADCQYALENGEQGDYSATLESWGAGK